MRTRKRKLEKIEFRLGMILEQDGDGFHVYCPALPGLHTDGETEEEALNNAKDAAVAYLSSLMRHQEPIPVGSIVAVTTEGPPLTVKYRDVTLPLGTPALA